MTTINDLRGFCYPLTPGGVSSLVGDLPWHYATEYVTIAYRTDPAAIAAYLPEPLAPGPEPDLAYVAFSRWWSLWDNQPEMAFTNPERTQYRECAIWVFVPRHGGAALSADLGEQRLHPGSGLVYGVCQEVGADLSDGISSPEPPDAAFRPRGKDERLCLCPWGAID